MISEDALRDIVERIRESFPVRKILLFGSQARGDAHRQSDLNLCVILAPDTGQSPEEWPSKDWLYRAAELIQHVSSTGLAVNPYVFTESEFDAMREREHPLIGRILEEGRVVYEQ